MRPDAAPGERIEGGSASLAGLGLVPHHQAGFTWYRDPQPWRAGSLLATGPLGLGSEWSCIVFLAQDDETFYIGRLPSGIYSARFGRRTGQLSWRVADMMRYEHHWERRVVVASEYALDIPAFVSEALASTPLPGELRLGDPAILVHSTTCERWPKIQDDARLRSASELRRAGLEIAAIAFETFGEPPEYAQFIHFSPLGVPNGEAVVLSHQRRALITDLDGVYTPGARIYLRAHKMVRDGLTVRDGLHTLKVHRELPLDPYLVDVITPDDLQDQGEPWTPRRFATEADRTFIWRHLREPGT